MMAHSAPTLRISSNLDLGSGAGTFNFGTGAVDFLSGGGGSIELRGNGGDIIISAASIDLGGRVAGNDPFLGSGGSVMLTASTGDLTLMGDVSLTNALTLMATSGAVDLQGDNVNIGANALSITITAGAGVIGGRADGTTVLTASTITLMQSAALTSEFALADGVTSLTIAVASSTAQPVMPWMASTSGNWDLALTNTGGDIAISSSVNVGAGDLTLTAASGGQIAVSGTGEIQLRGENIILGSAVTGASFTDRRLLVRAADTLTVNGAITLTGANANLTLRAATFAPGTSMLDAAMVSLVSNGVFGGTAPFSFAAGVASLTFDARGANPQTVEDWMVPSSGSRTVTITANGIAIGDVAGGDNSLVLNPRDGTIAGSGTLTITGSVTINANAVLDTAPFTISEASGLIIELGSAVSRQDLQSWMVAANRDLTIRMAHSTPVLRIANNLSFEFGTGAVDLLSGGGRIVFIRASGNRDDVTLQASTITLGGTLGGSGDFRSSGSRVNLIASAGDVTLMGDVTLDNDLTITTFSGGAVTLGGSSISIGANVLLIMANGAINFAEAAVSLTGETITLTSGAEPDADPDTAGIQRRDCATCDVRITAQGDLTLTGMFDTGDAARLFLGSIGGAINFGGATTLSGRVVALTAPGTPRASDAALTITGGGVVNINANINTGTGDLTIIANMADTTGTLRFTTGREITLNGGAITLAALGNNAPRASNQTLRITALNDLTVNANINTGSRNLILVAGAAAGAGVGRLVFATARSVELRGRTIRLESQQDPTPGAAGNSLTLRASGNIALFTDLTLADAAEDSSILSLVAGGEIRVFGDRTLTAGTLVLQQGLAFGSAAPATLAVQHLHLRRAGEEQAYYGWMDAAARSLTLEFATLTVGGTVSLDGVDINLLVGEITGENVALTITTSGDVLLGGNIIASGSGGILMITAGGAINFAPTAIRLGGVLVSLTSAAEPDADPDTDGIQRRSCTDCPVEVISNNPALTGIFDAGASDLIISEFGSNQGAIGFGQARATILRGRDVRLTNGAGTGSGRSNQDLTITASRHATIASPINTGSGAITISAGRNANINADLTTTGDLTITANTENGGVGAIRFSTARAVNLQGGDIELHAMGANPVRSGGAAQIVIRSSGNILLNTNLNSSGVLTVNADGAINFGANPIRIEGTLVQLVSGAAPDADPDTAGIQRRDCNLCHVEIIAEVSGGTASIGLEGDIDVGANSNLIVTIIGNGNISFRSDRAVSLKGRVVRLTSSGTESFEHNQDLTIEAERHVIINAGINTGTGDLTINAGRNVTINRNITSGGDVTITANMGTTAEARTNSGIFFSTERAVVLNGADITLTVMGLDAASPAPRASNQDLTITATGTLTLNTHLNAGSGALALTAGSGAITFNDLTARQISLTQVDIFGDLTADQRVTLTAGDDRALSLSAFGSGTQMLHDWIVDLAAAGDTSLSVSVPGTGGNLMVDRSFNLGGSSDLTLVAGGTLSFADAEIRLEANDITLASATAQTGRSCTDCNVDVIARQALNIGGLFDVGDAARLLLISTNGAINFGTTGMTSLSGRVVRLVAPGTPTASERILTINAQLHADIRANINTGNADVRINANLGGTTGLIRFTSDRPIAISSRDITLDSNGLDTAAAATNQNLNLNARRALVVNANINTGTGRLVLNGGTGTIAGTGSLTAASLRLIQNGAFAINNPFTGGLTLSAGFVEFRAITNLDTRDWMAEVARAAGADLRIRAQGNVTIASDIVIDNDKSLVIQAGRDTGTGTIAFAGGTFALSALNINLIAATAPPDTNNLDVDVTITAAGFLQLFADLYVGAGMLVFDVTGAIRLPTSQDIRLTAGSFTLNGGTHTALGQKLILRSAELFVGAVINGARWVPYVREVEFITTNTGEQTMRGWMRNLLNADSASGVRHLILRGAGDVVLGGDIAAGNTRTLTVEAGMGGTGGISFGTTTTTRTITVGNLVLISPVARELDGNLNLTIASSLTMQGAFETSGTMTITAATSPVTDADLNIDADGALTINAPLNTGTGNLGLVSGGITAEVTGAITINAPLTTASTELTNIASDGDITINAALNFGAGTVAVTVSVGGIFVNGEITAPSGIRLSATGTGNIVVNAPITITDASSAVTLDASGGNVVVRAALTAAGGAVVLIAGGNANVRAPITSAGGDITINTGNNANVRASIDAGDGALSITSGSGTTTGAINFDTAVTINLTGGSFTLTADTAPTDRGLRLILRSSNVFVANPFLTTAHTSVSELRLITTASGSNAQTLQGWMDDLAMASLPDGGLFRLRAGGEITIGGTRDFGATRVIFDAGAGDTTGGFSFTTSTALTAQDITLRADAGAAAAGDVDITLTAEGGNITIGADISVNSGALNLLAASGEIRFSGTRDITLTTTGFNFQSARRPTERADLQLTFLQQNFSGINPFNQNFNVRAIVLRTSAGQTVHSWMETLSTGSAPESFTIETTGGSSDITVSDSFDFGSTELTLQAGGTLNFGVGGASSTLEAGAVILRSSATTAPFSSNHNITISATRDIDIAARIDAGSSGLTFSAGGSVNVTGDSTLLAGSLVWLLTNSGDIVLGGDIDAGSSNVSLSASGGVIRNTARAEITGNNIGLTASNDMPAGAANTGLTITAAGDVSLNANLNVGNNTLSIDAGGAINFASRAITLQGGIVSLTSTTAPDARSCTSCNVNITATNVGVTLNGMFDVGNNANLIVTAFDPSRPSRAIGISFSRTVPTSLAGRVVRLIGVGIDTSSGQDLTINAQRWADIYSSLSIGAATLTINANLANGGAGNFGIRFSRDRNVNLGGNNIILNAEGRPPVRPQDVSNRNLRLTSFNATINTDINIGSGDLRIAATGENAAITFDSPTIRLTADQIRLEQAALFSAAAPAVLEVSSFLTFETSSTDPQMAHAWMIPAPDANIALTLIVGGRLDINQDIILSSSGGLLNTLNISARSGGIRIAPKLDPVTGDASDEPRILRAGIIDINGDIEVGGTAADGSLVPVDDAQLVATALTGLASFDSISNEGARGSVTLRAGIQLGTRAGEGITAATVTLEQGRELFGATAPVGFFTNTTSLNLTTRSTSQQPLRGWMVADGRSLSLTAAGAIGIGRAAIDFGTGDLTLSTARNITFTTLGNHEISAGTISMTAAAVGAGQGLTVTADTFNLNVNELISFVPNANIDLGGVGTLNLQNSEGALISTDGTVTLAETTRTQDADGNAFAAPLTIRAGTLALPLATFINIGASLLAITVGATPANLAERAIFAAGRYDLSFPCPAAECPGD